MSSEGPRSGPVGTGRDRSRERTDSTASDRVTAALHPVVWILVTAGIFDWLSGNPIHGVLLFVVAALLLWDGVVHVGRDRPAQPEPALSPPPGWVLVMTGLLYAVLIGEFGRYSWPATVAVIAAAALGLVLAWRGPLVRRAEESSLTVSGVLVWAGVFVVLGLWELTQLLLQPTLTTDSYAHPTISVLTDPVLASHVGRSILLFVWLAAGWFLVRE
jgi:hypothetical protein